MTRVGQWGVSQGSTYVQLLRSVVAAYFAHLRGDVSGRHGRVLRYRLSARRIIIVRDTTRTSSLSAAQHHVHRHCQYRHRRMNATRAQILRSLGAAGWRQCRPSLRRPTLQAQASVVERRRRSASLHRRQSDRTSQAVVRAFHEHGAAALRPSDDRLGHGAFVRELRPARVRSAGRRDRGDVAWTPRRPCRRRQRHRSPRATRSSCRAITAIASRSRSIRAAASTPM